MEPHSDMGSRGRLHRGRESTVQSLRATTGRQEIGYPAAGKQEGRESAIQPQGNRGTGSRDRLSSRWEAEGCSSGVDVDRGCELGPCWLSQLIGTLFIRMIELLKKKVRLNFD
jgi:hypothetical protein